MTTVDPRLVAEINQLETPCQILDDHDRRCGDPAAWIVTFTVRRRPVSRYVAAVCLVHKANLDRYDSETGSFDVEAVEL